MSSIVFIDIDGVLLSTRSWMMPENQEALRLLDAGDLAGAATAVQFDPLAVNLVRRLAVQSGAKLVLCSSWRRTVRPENTLQKLAEQGLGQALFHQERPCTPIIGLTTPAPKRTEIRSWLEDHPAVDAHVVLDDERGPDGLVRLDPDDGMDMRGYRTALRALGGLDPDAGVHPIPEEAWVHALRAHEGDVVAASAWLHTVAEGARPPADLLYENPPKCLESFWILLARDTGYWRSLEPS